MDLSASTLRPHGPLTQQEKDRRRKLGLCIYCAGSGHVIRNCPVKPSGTSLTGNLTSIGSDKVKDSGKA